METSAISAALAGLLLSPAQAATPPALAARTPEDETLYFAPSERFQNGDPSNDRGGATGGRQVAGYDPTDASFYQGDDLKGLTNHLNCVAHLGATALWVGPVFRNRWVQGPPGRQSAGHHGYWITDFTDVDPHLGTGADFGRPVDAAYARGLKVSLDLVINHTADVIRYRERPQSPCAHRSRARYPHQRRGGVSGAPINAGFSGDDSASASSFARPTRPDYAYTP